MPRSVACSFALILLATTAWGQERGRKGRERGEEGDRGQQMIQGLFNLGDMNRDGFLNPAEFNRSKTALGQYLARRQQGPNARRPGRGPQREGGPGAERGKEGERRPEAGGPNLAAFNSNPDKNKDKVVSLNEFEDWVHSVLGIAPPGSGPEGERRRPERKEQD